MARFDLTDFKWSVIEPLLPTKVRYKPRVDDGCVLNGIFWRLRASAPWADISAHCGPQTTCATASNDGVIQATVNVLSKRYQRLMMVTFK